MARGGISALIASAALLCGGCGGDDEDDAPGAERAATGAPNIVVVMTDDQDAASVEVMPNVRREIRSRGVEFTNSYVALSECCPSRVTFLTGQHAHNHGVETSKPPEGGYPALDSTNTLAVWLDEAGYRTGMVGRYVNFYGNSNVGTDPEEVPPGWDDWHVPVEHTEFQVYDYVLNENGELVEYGDSPADYSTDVFARKASAFIRDSAEGEEPFFLWVAPAPPHSEGGLDKSTAPRNPRPAPRDEGAFEDVEVPRPPSFGESLADKPRVVRRQAKLGRNEPPDARLEGMFRGRMESLLAVDRMVGGIIRSLRQAGELERTYVFFTSDNGFLHGEHRQTGKNQVYEESVRVPLLARGPGIRADTERAELVQNIDLAPTIAAAAGAEPGLELDGIDLFGGESPERDLFLTYPQGRGAFDAVRSRDGYVYVEYVKGERELYDLDEDPFQLDNLAEEPDRARVRERLASQLEELRGCAGEGCR